MTDAATGAHSASGRRRRPRPTCTWLLHVTVECV